MTDLLIVTLVVVSVVLLAYACLLAGGFIRWLSQDPDQGYASFLEHLADVHSEAWAEVVAWSGADGVLPVLRSIALQALRTIAALAVVLIPVGLIALLWWAGVELTS